MKTNEITQKYRKDRNLSLRAFAEAINERLINTDVSFSAISRWENKHYEPELSLLFECIATYRGDWRAHWAADNIHAMYPDLVDSGIIAFKLPNPEAR